ncbi:MAG: DUF6572 domain-containing protein [Rickettsiales bacterium]
MSIEDTSIVDFIGLDEQKNVRLTISDHLSWGDEQHLFLLQEKVNCYISFIESGEILEKYPESMNKRVIIDLVCKFSPSTEDIEFIKKIAEIVKPIAGFEFKIIA